MKTKVLALACLLAAGLQPARAIPVLSGSGLEPDAANGTFGVTGRIFEYRLQGSPGLAFTATQTATVDALRLSYAFTATADLSAGWAAAYLDADINQDANTWFNERGEAAVAAGGATSWEIDEPGFGAAYVGDIYTNYVNGTFDNSAFNGQPGLVEDVSFGLGFDFGNLGAGDELLFEIMLSESNPGAGWGTILRQWDDTDGLDGENLYFAGRFGIRRAPPPPPPPGEVIPEPGSAALLGLGLMALLAFRRRR